MYESHWQLDRKPFESWCDPGFYYPGESHQAALLKLRYAIENRRGGALLAGPSGTGKTLIVGMLRRMLAEDVSPIVHLVFPQMSAEELLAYMAIELGASTPGGDSHSIHQSVSRIENFLAENTDAGKHAVVVVDEAQLLGDPSTLEALRLVLNFESDGRPGLTLLLAGQPGILPTIDRVPQFEERLGVKCLVRPFTEPETGQYVTHRLQQAGAKQAIFEPEAFSTLHQLTHGIARRINRLCDLALLIGYAEQCRVIRAAQLEAVNEELVSVVPE